jgi:Phasin protein
MAASGRALFDTMQELHREWLSFGQAQFSESMEAGREFARCRSPRDLFEVQMRYTPFVGEPDLSVRLASASLQPLQARAGFAERPRS